MNHPNIIKGFHDEELHVEIKKATQMNIDNCEQIRELTSLNLQ